MASRTSLAPIGGTPAFLARSAELQKAVFDAIPDAVKLSPEAIAGLPANVMDVPRKCGLLSARQLEITELDTCRLCQKISKGVYTAVEVVTAFGLRAAIAHQLVHCLTEFFLDEALVFAAEQDAHFAETGKTVGPLHGIPIAVDHMPVKGHIATAGFLSTLEISLVDGDQIGILRAAGAIFHCKTNQPQAIMHGQALSVFGRTLSPYNHNLVPHGSSGGTAALLALRGACVSPGTDIGGSIRAPAGSCGIYRMRPSSRTMPTGGHLWYQGGWEGIVCSTGPMAVSARDVDLFIKVVLDAKFYVKDPFMVPSIWSPPDLTQKILRVGYMYHDDNVRPHPPIKRSLEWVVKTLAKAGGFELVPFRAYEAKRGAELACELYFPEGKKEYNKLGSTSGKNIVDIPGLCFIPLQEDPLTVKEIFDLTARREAFRQAFQAHWLKQNVDVLLCPAGNATALPHDTGFYWGYTSYFNLVDYPGFVFPTGLVVDPAPDKPYTDFAPMSALDEKNNAAFDAELMKGTPIGVQLLARKYDDSLLVAAQSKIETALKSA